MVPGRERALGQVQRATRTSSRSSRRSIARTCGGTPRRARRSGGTNSAVYIARRREVLRRQDFDPAEPEAYLASLAIKRFEPNAMLSMCCGAVTRRTIVTAEHSGREARRRAHREHPSPEPVEPHRPRNVARDAAAASSNRSSAAVYARCARRYLGARSARHPSRACRHLERRRPIPGSSSSIRSTTMAVSTRDSSGTCLQA